jgi:RimJ/RimL family protein N-acetyltransferase
VAGLLTVALDHRLTKVTAETALDNIASQRTLIRAGFRFVGSEAEVRHYEIVLDQNLATRSTM